MKTSLAGRRGAWVALVLIGLGVVGLLVWMVLKETHTLRPAQRVGPPGLVKTGGVQVLWLLTRQEESRPGKGHANTRHHFDLHGHDEITTQRLWTRRLLTVNTRGGGNAEGRILGQHGPVVWVFLNDQAVALSAADGSVQGGRLAIIERNPGLVAMWPDKLKSFAFDNTLIVTTADALHWRIDSQNFAATSYQPEDADAFARVQYMSSTWNGGYQTADFLTRHLRDFEERWFGLFSEREAADAAQDGFGSNFKNPDRVMNEGKSARRTFWLAKIGKTRAFSEGQHDRLMALTPVPDSPVFLQGGLMRAAGERDALYPGADGGAVVVHRTRIDDQGLLSMTRMAPTLKPAWSTVLPIAELHNRWQLARHLLMMGSVSRVESGVSRTREFIVSLNLDDGTLQQFDLQGKATD